MEMSDTAKETVSYFQREILEGFYAAGLAKPNWRHMARMSDFVKLVGDIESTGGRYLSNVDSSAQGKLQILRGTFPDTIRNSKEIYEAAGLPSPPWIDAAEKKGRSDLTDAEGEALLLAYIYRQEDSHETFAQMVTGNVDAATKLYTDFWHKGSRMKSAQLQPTDPKMEALLPEEYPKWLQRALDPSTPTTKWNETVKTTVYGSDNNTILVPSIRMNSKGKLFNPKDPLQAAIDAEDFIPVEGGIEQANRLSKYISNVKIQNVRNPQAARNKKAYDRAYKIFSNNFGEPAPPGQGWRDELDTPDSRLHNQPLPEGDLYDEEQDIVGAGMDVETGPVPLKPPEVGSEWGGPGLPPAD